MLFVAGILMLGNAQAESRVQLPQTPVAKGDKCVEPIDVIRRNHMDLLKHQRNESVGNISSESRYSFKGCIDCHVLPNSDGNYPKIGGRDHFCSSCHQYVGVRIDCFECHATRPDEDQLAVQ